MLQLPTSTPPWSKEHPSLLRPHTACSVHTRIQATLSGCHGENPLPLQSPHPANTNILSILLARWRHAGLEELQQNSDGPESHTQLHPSTKHKPLQEWRTRGYKDCGLVLSCFTIVWWRETKLNTFSSETEPFLYTVASWNLTGIPTVIQSRLNYKCVCAEKRKTSWVLC